MKIMVYFRKKGGAFVKKFTALFLLMITLSTFIGCDNTKNEVALKPIHNIQTINKKRTTDKIVYTTKNGSQYHRSNCRHLGYTNSIRLSDAKKAGYSPCTVCNP